MQKVSMKMKRIAHGEHLIQLRRFATFNSYLVREDDGFTLIDTGLPGSAKGILRAAAQQNMPIRRVVLTHAHSDHVGSLDAIAAQLPDADFLFTPRTAAFLRGDLSILPGEPDAKLRGGFQICQTAATRFIESGEQVGSLEVIAAPGHSPDLVAFLDRRDGTLIAGDAFQTQAGIAVAGVMRWLFPFPALATWHLPTAVESAQKLAALNPTRLAVGHGPVLEQPVPAMQRAIQEATAHVGHELASA